jgi:hypothetical protein
LRRRDADEKKKRKEEQDGEESSAVGLALWGPQRESRGARP